MASSTARWSRRSPRASAATELAEDAPARLETFDLAGRRVAEQDIAGAAGEHELPIAAGRRLPPGVYMVRLQQLTRVATSRVVVLP